MSKLKSMFGAHAENMQIAIDNRNDRFDPLFFPTYFPIGLPQVSLDYTSVIGASRIEAAASIVNRDSPAPPRTRQTFERLSGTIPPISEKFHLKESDMRDFEVIKSMTSLESARKEALMKLIWDDVRKAGNAPLKRIDMLVLEGLSTGKLTATVDNNPDGITFDLDLLMPSENKTQAAVQWGSTSATPITDIQNKVEAARAKGVTFSKMLMSSVLFGKFRKTTEVLDTLKAFYYGPKPGAGFNPIGITTLSSINEFLTQERLPVIEIVDNTFGVEKGGKIQTVRPFSDNNVSFIPAGTLGEIKQAVSMEKIRPAKNCDYAVFKDEILISKWSTNEPLQEWTKGEWNAFPSFSAIDSVYLLTAVF